MERRRFLQSLGAGAVVVAGAGGLYLGTRPQSWELEGTTAWALHSDTSERPLNGLYSGSIGSPGCDTAATSTTPGPGRLSAYYGGLYVDSHRRNRLRTGRYEGPGTSFLPLTVDTATSRLARWASSVSFEPDYRFEGRILVREILPRPPDSPSGLTFHPVHIDNCSNYFLRFWQAADPRRVTFSREVRNGYPRPFIYDEVSLPREPLLGQWYEFRIDVLKGGRFRFRWNGQEVFDITDPHQQYVDGGPVGMRMDYFDTLIEDTRVVRLR